MTSKDLDRLEKLAKDVLNLQGETKSKAVLEMVELIDTIPKEKTRKIFRMRYIYGYSWRKIADKMEYDSSRGPRIRVQRYKKAISVPFQEPKNNVK